jgi:adenosylcobinamide-phosphate synthase
MRRSSGLASGLLLGAALDALAADPAAAHPVAAFGSLATRLEGRLWAATRTRGAIFTAACVAPVAAAGWALQRLARRGPLPSTGLTAVATWTVLGAASLARQATKIAEALDAGDLATARDRLPALCGRDPDRLDAPEIARATVESVAENTSDAVVAPLFWGAVAGVPGLLAYRAINTLDAMVGHRSQRYERFGWAAARLDDAANWAPARATALLAVALARVAGGSPRSALTIARRDGAAHPSPNAGRCEAAFAGALGVQLGGANAYHGRVEQRGLLGDGPPPAVADIGRAVRLSRLITVAAALTSAAAAGLLANRGPASRSQRGPPGRVPAREAKT